MSTYTFRFALCALHAISLIADGVAKEIDKLPNDVIDVSVAAYANRFYVPSGGRSKLTQDINRKARFLLDEDFLKKGASD